MKLITSDVQKDKIVFHNVTGLDLEATLHCGQAFRWSKKTEDGYAGIIFGRHVFVDMDENGDLTVKGSNVNECADGIRRYFDLDRDYEAIRNILLQDEQLKKAVIFAPGIHILNQDPWEALGSFIFSSNNNITRITKMIEHFCAMFGKPALGGGYCFPSPERVAGLNRANLAPLRCGYRDEYILDAARRVASGAVDLDAVKNASLDEGRRMLMSIRGVGPKVADCALLFGFEKTEAFPADVHVKRAMRQYFSNGLPDYAQPYAGIAQQYIFHWQRLREAEEAVK